MGLYNPFTYGRKFNAAWNALVGWYTFQQLGETDRRAVAFAANAIAEQLAGRSLKSIAEGNGRIVYLNFLVYGMIEVNIKAALYDGKWCHVSNPFVASIGADEMVEHIRPRLEKEYGVRLGLE